MNWKRFFVVAFALLVALSIGSGRLAAQTSTTGDVTGVVTDPSGAVVPDAKVSLKDETKGAAQEARTNKDGNYRFTSLTPGPYTVVVSAKGFEGLLRRVDVAVGQIATINISLTVGTASTTVTVTEAAPLLQTDNGDTSTTLSEQQISQVPNPGNDLSYIAQLAPGAVMNTMGGFGNVEAFGLPATSNLFTTNGMDNNDPFLNLNNSGATNLLLGSNEMQEADVVTNGYSGAYGTFAGININYVTKSGGNDFHGNLVYYWTGRAMDATDWISKANDESKPFNNANQWAASFGGPIKKDKLFFFVNTEGLRVLIPVPQTIAIPSVAFEQATIANLMSSGLTASIPYYCQNLPSICPGVGPAPNSGGGIFNFYNAVPNQSTAVPITGGVNNAGCGLAQTAPFPGEVPIPVLPGGASCTLSVQEVPINFAPEWQLAGRVDWNIGVNDRMFVRMQYDKGTQPSVTDPVNSIFNITSSQPEWQGQLVETHTFSPTLVNQFLMAGTWYSAIFKSPNEPATLAAFPTTLLLGDGSLSNIGGAIGFVFPQGRNVTQIQFGDDLSKTWGNHGIKVGFKFHRDYVSDHDNGFFTNGLQIPFTLTDFFNGGQNAQMQQNFAQSQDLPIRINNIAGYVQDEWRVKSNLTVTGSLRLEHSSNPNCATNCFATFAGGLAQGIANEGEPYNEIIQTGRSQALYSYQNLQWEPRVSFAWQPFGTATGMLKSNFVVRGGVGIFYDIFPGQIADNMASNSPLVNSFVIDGPGGASGGTCNGGFLSPNQPGNLFDCQTAANAAFNTAFTSGSSFVAAVPGIVTAQHETKAPQYQKWSLEIQKGFGANDSIDIGYYGNHGIHTPIVNPSLNAFGFATLPAAAPTDQFSEITQVQTAGVSNYNGLVASYKHRFSGLGGGVFQLNYTWSHAFDEVSNGGFNSFSGNSLAPQDPFNLRNNYGPSDYDVRNNLNANYLWQVPIRKALMGHGWAPLVDGWQVSGTVFYRTGFPFSVIDGAQSVDLNQSNYFGTILPEILNPNVNTNCGNTRASVPTTANGGVFTPCFSLADFQAATTETGFGPQGLRNKFRGPDYFNTDFSVLKNTKIPHWERGQLGIGFQFFNLFNHPNFSFPNNDISSGVFGRTTSMVSPPTSILGSFLGGDASPRLIQVKAQLTF